MDAIVIRDVTKRFKKNTIRNDFTTFKSELVAWIRGKSRRQEKGFIEALRGIDLVIPKGKTVGIIGRNGSGKSTLLKILTGIYQPTTGSVTVSGRVSALLDLGAGFHPEFSGRENIMVNGIILGMSRNNLKSRMQDIIDFAELGDFIDEPVRTYSSGMYMRLAFAVATHVDPDILIIDEILSVGDAHFSRKSTAKMDEFKASDRTIVLVTHDLGTVQSWCDLAAWIDGGKIRAFGDPRQVVADYQEAVALAEARGTPLLPPAISPGGGALPSLGTGSGGAARIERIRLFTRGDRETTTLDSEEAVEVCIDFASKDGGKDLGFGLTIKRDNGEKIYATNTFLESVPLPNPLPPRGTLRVAIDRIGLVAGAYEILISVRRKEGEPLHRLAHVFTIRSATKDSGSARPPHRWRLETAEASAQAAPRVIAS